jgi:hypothetical protein
MAVPPGRVPVEAHAPGWLPFSTTVDVAAGADATVSVALSPAPTETQAPGRRGISLLGPAVAGAGVVALATAGVLRLVSDGQYQDMRSTCDGGCTDAASRRSGIDRLDGAAIGAAVAGAGLVAIGATLFLLDRRSAGAPPTQAWVEAGPMGAALRGRF